MRRLAFKSIFPILTESRLEIVIIIVASCLFHVGCRNSDRKNINYCYKEGCPSVPIKVVVDGKMLATDNYYCIEQIEDLFRMAGHVEDAIISTTKSRAGEFNIDSMVQELSSRVHLTTKGAAGFYYLQITPSKIDSNMVVQILTKMALNQSKSTNYNIFSSFFGKSISLQITLEKE